LLQADQERIVLSSNSPCEPVPIGSAVDDRIETIGPASEPPDLLLLPNWFGRPFGPLVKLGRLVLNLPQGHHVEDIHRGVLPFVGISDFLGVLDRFST